MTKKASDWQFWLCRKYYPFEYSAVGSEDDRQSEISSWVGRLEITVESGIGSALGVEFFTFSTKKIASSLGWVLRSKRPNVAIPRELSKEKKS
jgi:hypothetical protein